MKEHYKTDIEDGLRLLKVGIRNIISLVGTLKVGDSRTVKYLNKSFIEDCIRGWKDYSFLNNYHNYIIFIDTIHVGILIDNYKDEIIFYKDKT